MYILFFQTYLMFKIVTLIIGHLLNYYIQKALEYKKKIMSKRVIVVLTPDEHYFSYIMVRPSYIQRNDDVWFVQDHHA